MLLGLSGLFFGEPPRPFKMPLCGFTISILLLSYKLVYAQTGSVYQLNTEYAGANFFNGWNFFTVRRASPLLMVLTDCARVEIRPTDWSRQF